MVGLAKKSGIKVLLLTPTPAIMVDFNDPNDPLNQQAKQIRDIAKASGVGLVDSHAVFQRYFWEGGKIEEILANKINHPNRKGHELVAQEIMKWFPSSDDRGQRTEDRGQRTEYIGYPAYRKFTTQPVTRTPQLATRNT